VDADAEPDAEALGDALAPADTLALAAGTIFADVLAVPVALADGDELCWADGLALGVELGVTVAALVKPDASRSTWRNRSRAVVLTSLTTSGEVLPGMATAMMLLPWVCTVAPELPVPLTREVMIEMVSFSSWADGFPPVGVVAVIVTSVPLDRSRPRPTLKSLCHAVGLNRLPPRMPRSITTMSAPSTASALPGCGALFAGGATSFTPA
jgi:hypothetical protein